MSILETKISTFNSTRDVEVNKELNTIRSTLLKFKNGEYEKDVKKVREGNEEIKKNLPTFAVHGIFENYRRAKDFIEASGIIIIDIDDIDPKDDLNDIKDDIMESCDHIVSIMVSPSGNGLKVLYYVNPDLVTADNYRQIGKQISNDFTTYGTVDYLSVTDCLIATYDPNIIINENAEAAYIYIKESPIIHKVELEKLDPEKTLWEDPEDFFDTVLSQDIESKTNNNFHYIQVALFDLAKYGFKHPKEDLSFVIHYAEAAFKHSKDNQRRFNESVEIAKTIPHSMWAYNTTRSGGEDDEEDDESYLDYSNYVSSKALKSSSKEETEENDTEVLENGMIDYDGFYDRILEVIKEGDRIGSEISLQSFSNIFRFKGTGILTVTGIPGHGKTEFIDQCILDLARLHGHESVVVGFEQTPEQHVIKLIKKIIGTNVTCPSYLTKTNLETIKQASDFITSKIKHIDTTKIGGNINTILELAAKHIKESRETGGNPKYVVIDPFNMLSIKGKFTGHEKIEEILRRLTHFSHQMDIMVILVAHPFKMKKDDKSGVYEVPDFYSVKGSSAFFEMSYHGLVVYRTGYNSTDSVLVRVLKVKQNNLGTTMAEVSFTYERNSGRYVPITSEKNEESGDHRDRDWLEKALETNKLLTNKTK